MSRTCCEFAENEMTPPGLLAPAPPNEKLGVVLKENPPAMKKKKKTEKLLANFWFVSFTLGGKLPLYCCK